MLLSDKVPGTATPQHGNTDRSVGEILHDEQQRRSVEVGELPLSTFADGSPYRRLLELPDKVAAATAADEQRDNAALAAITALAAMVQNAGGNVDAAPIIAAVKAVGDDTHAQITTLVQQRDDLLQRLAALQAELDEVKADTDAQLSPAERAAVDGAAGH